MEQSVRQIFTSKDVKVESISLDELSQSVRAEEVSGLSASKPIEHIDLFNMVYSKINNAGYNAVVDNIYAYGGSKASFIKKLESSYGEKAIESCLLQRLSGKINISDFSDDESGSSMAISYHDRGIDIAYGQNVHVCSNMSIFGGNLLQTYGPNKMKLDKILMILDSWISDLNKKRLQDLEYMNRMKECLIQRDAIPSLIGKMHLRAVEQAYVDSKVIAPLNISQLSSFSKTVLKDNVNDKSIENVWDLYNAGTDILKPQHSDIVTLIPDLQNFSNFMLDEYELLETNVGF